MQPYPVRRALTETERWERRLVQGPGRTGRTPRIAHLAVREHAVAVVASGLEPQLDRRGQPLRAQPHVRHAHDAQARVAFDVLLRDRECRVDAAHGDRRAVDLFAVEHGKAAIPNIETL